MRLKSPRLERAIRRLARREILASPALRKEFRRDHNPWLKGLGWVLTVIFLPIGLAPFGIILFVCLLGIMMMHICLNKDTDLSLASLALMLMGILLWTRLSGYHRLFGALDLRTAAYFPLSDRQLLREALKRVSLDGSVVALVFLTAFVYLVWFYDLTAWAYPLAVGAAVAQGLIASVLCLLIVACLPRRPWIGLAVFLVGLVLIACGAAGLLCAGFRVQPVHDAVIWAAIVLPPTGWVLGAFYWGVLQGQAVGWLLLVPAAWLIRGGVRWARRGIATREIAVDSPDPVPVVFDRGVLSAPDSIEAISGGGVQPAPKRPYADAAAAHAPAQAIPSTAVQPQPAPADADSTEAIEQRILEGGAMGRGEWTGQGWIERLVCRALTEREQTVIEYLTDAPPAWTLQWRAFVIILFLVGGLAWFLPGDRNPFLIPPLIAFAWVLSSGFGWVSCQGFFPIGFVEASRAVVKVAVLRSLLLLPLAVGFGLIVGWRFGCSALESAGLGLAPVVLYLGCVPFWICWLFGPR